MGYKDVEDKSASLSCASTFLCLFMTLCLQQITVFGKNNLTFKIG